MELDENGNPINPEGNEGWEEEVLTVQQLQEQLAAERAEKEKALSDSQKREKRFKTTKANENKTPWQTIDQESIKKMVDESVWTVRFYSENKEANQYQEDIEALVIKGIWREQAYKYVLAEKNPELLLDEQKKAQLRGNTALNWVPWKNKWTIIIKF